MSEGEKKPLSPEVVRVIAWLRRTADRWQALHPRSAICGDLRFAATLIEDHYGKKIDATQGFAYEGANREEK